MVNKLNSPLTNDGIRYTWRQLAQRAGITDGNRQGTGFDTLSIPVYYAHPSQVQAERPSIIVVPCAEEAWHKLLERPQNSLDWLSARETIPNGTRLPFDDSIPVLFWGEGYEEGNKPFAQQRDDGAIVFYADIVAATFFMLTRWEETVVPIRDMHDRFPATASLAYKQRFLDRPIVDQYALILQAWLKTLLPQWTPKPLLFSVKLSHDIDHIQRFSRLYKAPLIFGEDLLRRHSFREAKRTIDAFMTQLLTPEQDAYWQGIYSLADLSRKYGFKSAFYFMAAEPARYDSGYDPASLFVQRCVDDLRRQSHEIGFHPSYRTFNDYIRLAREKARLDAAFGADAYGGRQHFLRFQVPNTWRQWEQAGLSYDSTLGYADHEGFRGGTCHPFLPFDIEQNRELDIWERSLIVMDGTLRHYREYTPHQAEQRILELAQRCKKVGGEFTLLWHNSSLNGGWRPWVEVYQKVVERLARMAVQLVN